jgi:hypothetical protein
MISPTSAPGSACGRSGVKVSARDERRGCFMNAPDTIFHRGLCTTLVRWDDR